MCNKEIRKVIDDSGFKYWQIADAIGISNGTLSVWLRHDLTGERKKAVMDAIKTCKANQGKEG